MGLQPAVSVPPWLLYSTLVGCLLAFGVLIERHPAPWRGGPLFMGLSALGFGFALWFFGVYGPTLPGGAGFDVVAYWNVKVDDPYVQSLGQINEFGAFRYTPPMAYLCAPLHLLPFGLVAGGLTVLLFVALVWQAGRYSLAVLAFPAVVISIYEGNIDVLIAAAVVLGLRYPAAWAFVLLTKVTPGVGLLWFVVRREWRSLAVALGVTAAFVVPTLILRPDLWRSWIAVVQDNAALPGYTVVPLAIRLAFAAGLIVVGARTERPWLLGIAVAVAQPTTVLRTLAVAVSSVALARRVPDR